VLARSGEIDKSLARPLFLSTYKAYEKHVFSKITYDEEEEKGYMTSKIEWLRVHL